MRTPNTYLPGQRELLILVGESPRCEMVLDEFRKGHATAEELCRLLWPEVDPRIGVPGPGIHGMTPLKWVTEVMDLAATPCRAGGDGLCEKQGKDYVYLACDTEKNRPANLPRWPTN